jgi:hypothetical protein
MVVNCQRCKGNSSCPVWYPNVTGAAFFQCARCRHLMVMDGRLPFENRLCSCGGHYKLTDSPVCPICLVRLTEETARITVPENPPIRGQSWPWPDTREGFREIFREDKYWSNPFHERKDRERLLDDDGDDDKPPKSLAEIVWENRWKWPVGKNWLQQTVNLGVFFSLARWLTSGREPPALALEKAIAHWNQWQQTAVLIICFVLITAPAYATALWIFYTLGYQWFFKLLQTIGKYFEMEVLELFARQALENDTPDLLDLTPHGGMPPWWMLLLFWPLAVFQWSLAALFVVIAGILELIRRLGVR